MVFGFTTWLSCWLRFVFVSSVPFLSGSLFVAIWRLSLGRKSSREYQDILLENSSLERSGKIVVTAALLHLSLKIEGYLIAARPRYRIRIHRTEISLKFENIGLACGCSDATIRSGAVRQKSKSHGVGHIAMLIESMANSLYTMPRCSKQEVGLLVTDLQVCREHPKLMG